MNHLILGAIMKPNLLIAKQIKLRLQKELNDPKLNSVKQTYLVEKIKMLGEFIVGKESKKKF
jgi:hypothetical protein